MRWQRDPGLIDVIQPLDMLEEPAGTSRGRGGIRGT
jgi:hypothetical protein